MLESLARASSVALYPSSCRYSEDFQKLPHDAVLLNSRDFRCERRIGKVWCLPFDNNHLLGVLARLGIRISTLVIIRDGCREGGNYECVTKDGYLGRLWPVLVDEFDLHCDHGRLPPDVPADFESIGGPEYLDVLIKNSCPLDDISSFHGKKCGGREKSLQIGRIKVQLFWDSLWSHIDKPGLKIVCGGGSAREAVQHYLGGRQVERDDFYIVNRGHELQIDRLLSHANELNLSRISLMPMGPSWYPVMLRALREWTAPQPQELCFYHLNGEDFRYFKKLADQPSP